ncbi:MAG TPA: aldo/keto reductase [Myxococcaceae bacterium]|nr:aldo/keto reductase [Myxococcaceae bacterium]
MQTRRFGWTGSQVPVIGQGTWKMEHDAPAEALAALQAGLDAGMTHVDTAELYGSGRVESLVGRALAGRRDQVFLVSKVMPDHASRSGTVRACEASLRRLGTDHLDCYLLHWPGPHPLEETFAGFEQLVRDGKIRHWGVSNFDVDNLEDALDVAGPRRIACNQVLYHLRARDIEDRVLPWCVEDEVAVVGYSPFGSGDFPPPQSRGGKVLGEVARAHGVSPHQVALAFLIRDPHVFAIPKSAKVSRVRENATAANLRLTAQEIARIEEAFPLRRGRGLPTI